LSDWLKRESNCYTMQWMYQVAVHLRYIASCELHLRAIYSQAIGRLCVQTAASFHREKIKTPTWEQLWSLLIVLGEKQLGHLVTERTSFNAARINLSVRMLLLFGVSWLYVYRQWDGIEVVDPGYSEGDWSENFKSEVPQHQRDPREKPAEEFGRRSSPNLLCSLNWTMTLDVSEQWHNCYV